MSDVSPWDLLARWVHIGAIVVLVGGAVFKRFVLIPAAESLPRPEHDALRARIMDRWKYFVHGLIALILISGLYNVIVHAKERIPLWHMLIGVKILLALVIFFIASALVGRSSGLAKLRQNAKFWLGLNITLAAVIILISGVLRYLPPKPTAAPEKPRSAPARAEGEPRRQ